MSARIGPGRLHIGAAIGRFPGRSGESSPDRIRQLAPPGGEDDPAATAGCSYGESAVANSAFVEMPGQHLEGTEIWIVAWIQLAVWR